MTYCDFLLEHLIQHIQQITMVMDNIRIPTRGAKAIANSSHGGPCAID